MDLRCVLFGRHCDRYVRARPNPFAATSRGRPVAKTHRDEYTEATTKNAHREGAQSTARQNPNADSDSVHSFA